MRIRNTFAAAVAAAVAAVVFSAAMQPVEASFVYYFEQVGDDVVVTGSGSFNTAALGDPAFTFDKAFLVGIPFLAQDTQFLGGAGGDGNGWLGPEDPNIYPVIQGSQSFNVLGEPVTNGTSSGDYTGFLFYPSEEGFSGYAEFTLDEDYVSGSPLSNTTTLFGLTNAALGYSPTSTWASPVLERTYTIHNPLTNAPTGDTIQIYSVPEPSQMVFMAGAGALLGAWRLRKLRRSRSVAAEAIAG